VKLPDAQLVVDTNILVHLCRGRSVAASIERTYGISRRAPRVITSIVTKGELKSLALRLGWGPDKLRTFAGLLAGIPAADIASDAVIDAYAELDHASLTLGRKMGKNDLWIAATTRVVAGVLLTTDADFDHLHPVHVTVERVLVE
jgi:tRNA(fMet)-specific endonuclease VapC